MPDMHELPKVRLARSRGRSGAVTSLTLLI
jgi:hypothetical protein